jgi:hypothetical protein
VVDVRIPAAITHINRSCEPSSRMMIPKQCTWTCSRQAEKRSFPSGRKSEVNEKRISSATRRRNVHWVPRFNNLRMNSAPVSPLQHCSRFWRPSCIARRALCAVFMQVRATEHLGQNQMCRIRSYYQCGKWLKILVGPSRRFSNFSAAKPAGPCVAITRVMAISRGLSASASFGVRDRPAQ